MDQWRISSQESISGLTGANRQRLVAASHFTFASPESLGLVDDQSRGGGGEAERASGWVGDRLALPGREDGAQGFPLRFEVGRQLDGAGDAVLGGRIHHHHDE